MPMAIPSATERLRPVFAPNAAGTPHSGIREVVHLVLSSGKDVIRLEVGEPTDPTPRHIVEAAMQDALAGYTRYTASAGYADLRVAIAAKVARVNGVAATPDNVVLTVGAVQGLYLLFAAFLEPQSEVLLPDPGWPNYEMIATMVGASSRFYPCRLEDGFVPRVEAVRAAITDRTRMLVLNSPNNPTGAVYPPEVVQQFVDLAEEFSLILVSDEAYDELYFGQAPTSPASRLPLERGRCVAVYSFSKTYSMTGWRLGYVVASRQISDMLAKLQEPTVSCAPAVSQRAALAALQGPQDFVEAQRQQLRQRRDLVLDKLRAAGRFAYVPQGAFYILIDVRPHQSRAFTFSLLESRCVSVAPGVAFGPLGDGFVRVCYASGGAQLAEAIDHITQAIG